MKALSLVLFLLLATLSSAAESVTIQNRILAKINSHAISVVDVAKKMDFVFFREFAAYAQSEEAKLQFYRTNWRAFLDDMIDEQLILASAKELKVTVSDGEVRQEIEDTLGPDVIDRIDQMGLTYPEIFTMVQNDLIVRRMVYSMVQAKATALVTPARVKAAYEQYAQEHPLDEAWNYQTVTIRATTELAGIAACQMFLKMIDQDHKSLDEAKEALQISDIQVTVSEEFHRTAKTLSEIHKAALAGLREGSHSEAKGAAPAKDGSVSYRIFFLHEHKAAGKIAFASVEETLKGNLIQQAVTEESVTWRKKLRERYGIDSEYLSLMVPENFQPFGLTNVSAK